MRVRVWRAILFARDSGFCVRILYPPASHLCVIPSEAEGPRISCSSPCDCCARNNPARPRAIRIFGSDEPVVQPKCNVKRPLIPVVSTAAQKGDR